MGWLAGWKPSPLVRQRLDKTRRVLHRADAALNTLWAAAGGTWAQRGLAAASLTGQALDLLFPRVGVEDALALAEFSPLGTGADRMFGRMLVDSTADRTIEVFDTDATGKPTTQIVYFGDRSAAVILDPEVSGLYVKSPAAVRMLLSSHAWASRDREIVLDRDGNVTLRNLGRLRPYIGTPSAEWLSARLSAYRGLGRNRTIQLCGPSGCGKTTLARSLGQTMCGTSAQTLRVTGGAAVRLNQRDLIDLVDLLGPDVFIIDDWAPIEPQRRGSALGSDTAPHLSFLEDLHARVPLTILTTMSEFSPLGTSAEARALGLRPGRVDEVIHIGYPEDDARRTLIEGFCADEELALTTKQIDHIVKGTEWFSGANLQELIGRIAVFGADSFEEETKRMGIQVEVASPAAARARRRGGAPRNPIQKGKIKPNAKVRDLRGWAGRKGLSKSGTRADLVARIEAHLRAKAEEAAARRSAAAEKAKGNRPAAENQKTKGES